MNIRIDEQQLGDLRVSLSGLSLNGAKILSRSLNQTARRAKTRAAQEISGAYRLKSTYVKSKLAVKTANYRRLQARVTTAKRGVLLTRYPYAILKRGGVSVGIRKDSGRKKITDAFKTTVQAGSNRVEVIARPDPSGGRYSTGNRRIKVLYSPSVSQLFNQFKEKIDRELVEYLDTVTNRELDAFLRGF